MQIQYAYSVNRILQNIGYAASNTWTAAGVCIDYDVDLHTTRNLHLISDLSEFRTIPKFDIWSGFKMLKQIPTTAGCNENLVIPYNRR